MIPASPIEPSPVRRLAAHLFWRGWFGLARLVLRFAPPATDRAHLLIAPEDWDRCDAFSATEAHRDCETDGHYLCRGCGRRVIGEAD